MKGIRFTGFVLAAFLCAPAAWCQQSPADQSQSSQGSNAPTAPDQPLPAPNTSSSGSVNDAGAAPAGRSLFGSGTGDSDQSQAVDQPPPSGAQSLGLAAGVQPANFFDASVLASGAGDNAVIDAQGNPTWGVNEVLGGGLTLGRAWSTGRFSLSYSGGAVLFQPSALYPTSMFHALSLGQTFAWKRLTLRLLDQFAYSPTSLFGGAGSGGPGLLAETGSSGAALNPTYASSSTILTGQSRLINNSAVAEIQYNLSLRSSFTATGSYNVLDDEGGGYISSHGYVFGAGYNYSFTPKDTLDLTYAYNQTHYLGSPESTSVQQFDFGYARQISGRLIFQASAGPQLIAFHGYTPSAGNELTWNATATLQYQLRRTSFGANYSRGANAGSGVFFGAVTQNVSGTATHEFSRFLVGVLNAGYTFNGNLVNVPGVSNEYHNWFAGGSISRQLGRYVQVSFNYGALQQTSNGACPVTSCGVTGVRQTIGASLDLHLRPIGSTE